MKKGSLYEGVCKTIEGGRSSRHDDVDVVRTVYWYLSVSTRLGARTAYELERRFEPNAFGKSEHGDHYHRNSWSKYERGKHKPRKALVEHVDRDLPGTARDMNHVLWTVLKRKNDAAANANEWLKQLIPEVQSIVFKVDAYGSGNNYSRNEINGRSVRALERKAGIDALACMTILIREAHDAGNNGRAFEFSESLFRILLMVCTDRTMLAIAQPIFGLYCRNIFSTLSWRNSKYCFEDFDFMQAISILRLTAHQVENTKEVGPSWKNRTQLMLELLSGRYGFDVPFALAPPVTIDGPITNENTDLHEQYLHRDKQRVWALNSILSGKVEQFLPDDVW